MPRWNRPSTRTGRPLNVQAAAQLVWLEALLLSGGAARWIYDQRLFHGAYSVVIGLAFFYGFYEAFERNKAFQWIAGVASTAAAAFAVYMRMGEMADETAAVVSSLIAAFVVSFLHWQAVAAVETFGFLPTDFKK